MIGAMVLGTALLVGCSEPARPPAWVAGFGYEPAQLHPLELGDYGYPYLPVSIEGVSLMLPFDTGNTVGISLSPKLFDRLQLTETGTYDRLSSAGELVATQRFGRSTSVVVSGRDLGPQRIVEFDHPKLEGMLSPEFLLEGHFTLDYGSRLFAAADAPLPETIPGFRPLPLVRSDRHPTLILVRGSVEGHELLIELDTGKSRTVINPDLAVELGLESRASPEGYKIGDLRLGDWSFSVASAKSVDQTAIDPGLPAPILAGVGSDILARLVWTVDYRTDTLWLAQ